ncbi:MAG: ImmA/IrrE family metallo-endopeptidase [Candidatus Cloacimonetes bacterium]|nr:ImmA/IrrE family metallo-endopeptidase [Candidatus Cloacimonadota bacterium]
MFKLKIIKSESDYDLASERLDELMDKDELALNNREEMELIAHLIEEYEEKAYPVELPSPIEAIKFRMEQMNLKQNDLVPYIGSKGVVSNILNGKRPLTLKMIRALHKGLQIPLEALVKEEELEYVDQPLEIDWDKFPIKEMYNTAKNVFFRNFEASCNQIKENAEYYLRELLTPYSNVAMGNTFCRQNARMSDRVDNYALAAWIAGCRLIADETTLDRKFDKNNEQTIIQQLKALTIFDEGPKLAGKYLQKEGIHLVILPNLPKTYLDGAVFRAKDDNPVIALTLRYDRIDHFWFTLFHELGHVFRHLGESEAECYLDELEISPNDQEERDADLFASENLIRDEDMDEAALFDEYSKVKVIEFAREHNIHPSIVAGRIRYKNNNYRILWSLVGKGEVRKLFNPHIS